MSYMVNCPELECIHVHRTFVTFSARHRGDITVDTVTDYVSRALGRDTVTVRRHYATELTTTNFYETLAIPRQFKFLLLHKQGMDLKKLFFFLIF